MTQEIPGSEDTSSMLKFVDLLAPRREASDLPLNMLFVLPRHERRKAAALQNKSTDHVRIMAVPTYGSVAGFRADVIVIFHDHIERERSLQEYTNWLHTVYLRGSRNCVIIED